MATGDVLSLAVVGGSLTDPMGRAVNYNGIAVAVKFAGMAVADTAASTAFDPSTLTLVVRDPGTKQDGTATTVTRTIKGTLATRLPFPIVWASGLAFAPKRYCQNGNQVYYTPNGGTAANAPTGTTVGATTTGADGVQWTCLANNIAAGGQPTTGSPYGYFDAISGSDAIVYAVLDDYIYAGTTILSATIGAGAYQTTTPTASSNASAAIPFTNGSTLPYEVPIVSVLTLPHLRSTGSIEFELIIKHARGDLGNGSAVPFVRVMAWDNARTTSATATTNVSVKSNIINPAKSPSGMTEEVYRVTLNTSGLPAGDSFFEFEAFPWLGSATYNSRLLGDGADWRAVVYPQKQTLIRNPTNGNQYWLSTVGTGPAVTVPSNGAGASTADANGYVWTVFNFGADIMKMSSANPQARHHFYNDPANQYRKGYAFVNPTGANIGTPKVWDTEAQAQAASSANSYGTVQLAEAAIVTYNTTVVGGTGGTITHADCGGGTVELMAGTHTTFGAVMYDVAYGSEWFTIKADRNASPGSVITNFSPNGNVPRRTIVGEGITWSGGGLNQVRDKLTVITSPATEVVVNALYGGSIGFQNTGLIWVLNCNFTGSFFYGQENTTSQIAYIAGSAGGMNGRISTMHGNKASGDKIMQDEKRYQTPWRQFFLATSNYFSGGSAGGSSIIFALNGSNGNDNPSLGAAFDGNVVESQVAGHKAITLAGDGSFGDLNNFVFTNNTSIGERTNLGYNDIPLTSQARTSWHIYNNAFWGVNSIDDYYNHAVGNVPVRDGKRAGNMAVIYNIRRFQNRIYTGNGYAAGFTQGMRPGYNTKGPDFGTGNAVPGDFVLDASKDGTAAGFGDYHPSTGSSLSGFATVQSRTWAFDGAARRQDGAGAVGALERADAPAGVSVAATLTATSGMTVNAGQTIALSASFSAVSGISVAMSPAVSLSAPLTASSTTAATVMITLTISARLTASSAMSATITGGERIYNPFTGYRYYAATALSVTFGAGGGT